MWFTSTLDSKSHFSDSSNLGLRNPLSRSTYFDLDKWYMWFIRRMKVIFRQCLARTASHFNISGSATRSRTKTATYLMITSLKHWIFTSAVLSRSLFTTLRWEEFELDKVDEQRTVLIQVYQDMLNKLEVQAK